MYESLFRIIYYVFITLRLHHVRPPVLFREGKSYLKGRYVSIARNSLWEVLYGDKYLYKSKDKVLLDEKPNLDEIPEGTAVVGEDPRGNLKEGKIKRVCSSIQCTIETDGEEWQSKSENV